MVTDVNNRSEKDTDGTNEADDFAAEQLTLENSLGKDNSYFCLIYIN